MPLFSQPNETFANANLNSVGSQYAADFNKDISLLVQKVTNRAIFDAAPQQFLDLKLMNMKQFRPVNSDEFFFKEMGFQREPLTATAAAGAVTSPTTQTFALTTLDNISKDTIIIYPNNQKGVVIATDSTTLEITVRAQTNGTLPAVSIADIFSNLSSIDHDASEGFSQFFRASTVERTNFVQLFHKVIRYGEVELHKLKNAAVTNNFLEMERNAMFQQFRIDMSNAFWNGEKGEFVLSDNTPAKSTQGVFPFMVAAGSPNANSTSATLADAFEDVVLQSEFGDHGAVRFAFMDPRTHLTLAKAYKQPGGTSLTRYEPTDDSVTKLNLKEIDIGSSRIVLVPFARFRDNASYPVAFKDRIVILDLKNINLAQLWAERSGTTLGRTEGVPKLFKDLWVDANMGVEFFNPLACAFIDVIT